MFEDGNKPIGFRINEISRLFNNTVRELVSQSGISKTCFAIIGYLKHNQDKKITQKDLCEFMKMKAPTISLTLQSMENDGLIIREKDKDDSRKTFVLLTDKGSELSEKLRDYFSTVDKMMEDALSKEEIEVFYSYLDKIKNALERK